MIKIFDVNLSKSKNEKWKLTKKYIPKKYLDLFDVKANDNSNNKNIIFINNDLENDFNLDKYGDINNIWKKTFNVQINEDENGKKNIIEIEEVEYIWKTIKCSINPEPFTDKYNTYLLASISKKRNIVDQWPSDKKLEFENFIKKWGFFPSNKNNQEGDWYSYSQKINVFGNYKINMIREKTSDGKLKNWTFVFKKTENKDIIKINDFIDRTIPEEGFELSGIVKLINNNTYTIETIESFTKLKQEKKLGLITFTENNSREKGLSFVNDDSDNIELSYNVISSNNIDLKIGDEVKFTLEDEHVEKIKDSKIISKILLSNNNNIIEEEEEDAPPF